MNEGKDKWSREIIREEGPTICKELSRAEGFRWMRGGWEETWLLGAVASTKDSLHLLNPKRRGLLPHI